MTKTSATQKTTRTRKLGRAQERRLNHALATDELLYRQFRRLNEDLQRAAEAFSRQKRVVEVIAERPGQVFRETLPILHVFACPEGTTVVVGLPPAGRK